MNKSDNKAATKPADSNNMYYDFMFDTPNSDSASGSSTSGDKPQSKPLIERLKSFVCNRQTWGFMLSVVIMALISIAFFYPDNFDGNDLRQHDMLQGMANSQELKAFEEATGETTRWTNSLFSGMPTFQISPEYPSDSLFRWITTVYGLGLPSPSNLLFMMMIGFMILMMALRVRWEYGLLGAIAWGLSSYFVIIIGAGHIWKFVTLAYIPPTLAGILLAYRGRWFSGGALAAIFGMMQLCSNHVQMTYYFGFVILGIMIAYLVACIRRKMLPHWLKATAALLVAAILALAANSPNLYHTWKYSKETQRGAPELVAEGEDSTSGLSRDYITQYSYGVSETLSLMIPNVKGGASAKPVAGQMAGMQLSSLDEAREYKNDPNVDFYLNYVSQYFGEPEGTNGPVYVGVVIFALFLVGCTIVRGPLKWALAVLTALSILLALGRNFMPLTDLFIDFMPLYSKFRTPESILVIAEFTMPLLAVLALYTLFTDKNNAERNFKSTAITFGVVALICLVGWMFPGIFGSAVDVARENYTSQMLAQQLTQAGYPDEVVRNLNISNPAIYNAIEDLHLSMVKADCLRSLLYLALAFIPLYVVRKGKVAATLATLALVVVVLTDLYTVDKRYVDHDSFVRVRTTTPKAIPMTDIDRAILADTAPNYRVLDIDRFASADPSYYHKMLGGYHAAKLGRYQDLIDRGLLFEDNVFNMLNAKYIVYQGQIMENPDALGNAWFVDEISYVDTPNDEIAALETIDTSSQAVADKRFSDTLGFVQPKAEGDTIYETSYAPNRLTYHSSASTDRVAAFSEVYFPWGWNVAIDGQPAELGRVNYVLRALRIPAGEHDIEMQFEPKSVGKTTTFAIVAVILIYLWVITAVAIPIVRKS